MFKNGPNLNLTQLICPISTKPTRFQVSAPGPVPTETLNNILAREGIPFTESPTPAPLERTSVCRKVHSAFKILSPDTQSSSTPAWLSIDVKPPGGNVITSPSWNNACSKLGSPGDCAWFVDGVSIIFSFLLDQGDIIACFLMSPSFRIIGLLVDFGAKWRDLLCPN